jgi:hypothetical protein
MVMKPTCGGAGAGGAAFLPQPEMTIRKAAETRPIKYLDERVFMA